MSERRRERMEGMKEMDILQQVQKVGGYMDRVISTWEITTGTQHFVCRQKSPDKKKKIGHTCKVINLGQQEGTLC